MYVIYSESPCPRRLETTGLLRHKSGSVKSLGFYPACKLTDEPITISWTLAEHRRHLHQTKDFITHSTARAQARGWCQFFMPLESHKGDKDRLTWVLCIQCIVEHWAWGIYCFPSEWGTGGVEVGEIDLLPQGCSRQTQPQEMVCVKSSLLGLHSWLIQNVQGHSGPMADCPSAGLTRALRTALTSAH